MIDRNEHKAMLKAIQGAMDSIMYARESFDPYLHPETWHWLCETLKSLSKAFEDAEAAEDASRLEPPPLPDPCDRST